MELRESCERSFHASLPVEFYHGTLTRICFNGHYYLLFTMNKCDDKLSIFFKAVREISDDFTTIRLRASVLRVLLLQFVISCEKKINEFSIFKKSM